MPKTQYFCTEAFAAGNDKEIVLDTPETNNTEDRFW